MANTTNFNWETPDDTDLVKDGAAAIRTLGSAIDTSLVDLKGGTTDQVLAKNSNTDMDFKWVTSDDANAIQNAIVDAKGDIIAASANDTPARLAVGTDNHRLIAASGEATGLKYVADTQNTVIDAAGDLVYGTAADTLGRLAIGTAGQVLQVNSGATAPEWVTAAGGGGMTLLSTTTLSGASTTVSVTTGYTDLYVVVYGMTNNTTDQIFSMRTQNSGSVYRYTGVRKTASTSAVSGGPDTYWNMGMNEYPLRTNANNIFSIRISDYLNTSHYKTIEWFGSYVYPGPNQAEVFGGGVVLDNSAITDLVFANTGGTFSAGTVKLYGVK
jgi:hypothetical protein